jgi:cephalosporin hydroxylase
VEDLPAELFPDRPWRPGDSPRTAVQAFLKGNDRFQVDEEIENKLLVTVAPGGYLRCVRESHS